MQAFADGNRLASFNDLLKWAHSSHLIPAAANGHPSGAAQRQARGTGAERRRAADAMLRAFLSCRSASHQAAPRPLPSAALPQRSVRLAVNAIHSSLDAWKVRPHNL